MRSLSLEALGSPAAETDIKTESLHPPVTPAGLIRRFHSQSRPRLASPSTSDKNIGRLAQYGTSTFQKLPTEKNSSPSFRRRSPSTTTQMNDSKAYMSSYSVKSPSPTEGLVKENRSLHQRISALQRTESDLLNENQELAGRLSSAQRRYNSRRQQWAEELMSRENTLNARIRDLEAKLAQKEEVLSRRDFNWIHEGPLDEADIVIGLAAKTTAWRKWVDDFTHRDPNRVRSGLHPMQLRELCEGVRHFVRLNNKGELPEELLNPPHSDGSWSSRVLLHGMLANFIIFETLNSPFWVFDAISANANELESPSTPRLNSISPVGFRMDLVPWSSSIVPPRELKPPQPFFANAIAWRASLMKALSEGGIGSTDESTLLHSDFRFLAEARVRYAGRLKDTFLRGPARFLLRDQDAAGIEKLERRLVQEIDAALRFSCQLWCRHDIPQIHGLHELAKKATHAASDDIRLCRAQVPPFAEHVGSVVELGDETPGYPDGLSVIMVLQPSVGAITSPKPRTPSNEDSRSSTKIWIKASVLVGTPKPSAQPPVPPQESLVPPPQASAPIQPRAISLDAASITATVGPPPSPTALPVLPNDAQETPLTLLPSIAFRGTPRPLLK
ncbi:hypothetical protein C7999DRAFT_14164 [Corynascus novoguineensis]|uniref:Uncharacterized protein n=1 Tax=Corynascus novoguineensis TaxID=1126955 RepID=A0AAN7CU05_9PEZI|nr:hypothetical protein C7999DRAFT_14164 [Corynascus novoguineensis]